MKHPGKNLRPLRLAHGASTPTQLLLQYPPGEVTVVKICDASGVHTNDVARYFGSREELLRQAIEAAFLGVFLQTGGEDTTRLNVVLEGNVDVMQLSQARGRTSFSREHYSFKPWAHSQR